MARVPEILHALPGWAQLVISAVLLCLVVVVFFSVLAWLYGAVEWLHGAYRHRSSAFRRRFRGTMAVFLLLFALSLAATIALSAVAKGGDGLHWISASRRDRLLALAGRTNGASIGFIAVALTMLLFTNGLKKRCGEAIRRLLEAGDVAEALRELEDVRHEPGQNVTVDSEIACLYAYALVLSGRVREALDSLEASERHLQGSVRWQQRLSTDEHRLRWNVESLEAQRVRIGCILCEVGHFHAALELADKAVAQTRTEISRQRLRGLALVGLGDFSAARESFSAALRAAGSLSYEEDVQREAAIVRLNLGECHLLEGRYSPAAAILRQARDELTSKVFVGHPDLIECQCLLARVHAAQGLSGSARDSFEAALQGELKYLLMAGASLRERDLFRLVHRMQVHLEQYLSYLVIHARRDPDGARAGLEQVLLRKGLALQVRLWSRPAKAGVSPAEKRLGAVRRQLSEKLFSPQAVAEQQEIERLESERETLEDELARTSRNEDFYSRLRTVSVQAVQARLPAGSVLIEFAAVSLRGESGGSQGARPHYLAFILPPHPAPPKVFDLGPAEPIDALIRDFHAEMETFNRWTAPVHPGRDLASWQGRSGPGWRELSRALFDRLVAPWLPLCRTHPKWILSPDGGLCFVPFPALMTPEMRFLVESVETIVVSSGRDLLRDPPRESGEDRAALLLGDPEFTPAHPRSAPPPPARQRGPYLIDPAHCKRAWFSPLPGTREEIEEIAQVLRTARLARPVIRLGHRATKAALLAARNPFILHLATHAFFLPARVPGSDSDIDDFLSSGPAGGESFWGRISSGHRSPYLRSGLVLAGANSRDERAALVTAEEVLSMALEGTELVVLSACQTALGLILRGEGVLGLHRAFMIAGARTVLASLWKVSDAETAILMRGFYTEFLKTGEKGHALRAAMLDLLTALRRSGRDCHPALWGAFFCFGPPSPPSLL